jgi:protoheme IX farnesyltransferase
VALLKPRVMSLVVFTAFAGMVLAPGPLNPFIAAIAILCVAVGAGASGALNMWYDSDIDAVMKRTAGRPIPAGQITGGEALGFGLILASFSVMTMGLLVNWLSDAILAFTIFFYSVIYTMLLKRSTPQNIVIGGAAGAFPPMIGWAVTSDSITVQSIVLFLIIFVWTPPHFWSLALFKSDEYAKAGVPMMPNVAGIASTKRQIFAYSVLMAPIGVLPFLLGFAGPVYGVVSTLLGAGFLWHAFKVLRLPETDPAMRPAKAMFGYSILYLFFLFAMLLGEGLFARAAALAGL